MTSDALHRQRPLAKQIAAAYRASRNEINNIHQLYKPGPLKDQLLQQLIAKQKALTAELRAKRERSDAELAQRASARTTQGTPEGRAKVLWALEHGFSLHELAQQLVTEKDRVGLASLTDFLPYAEKAGFLNGTGPRAIEEASTSIAAYESQLHDEQEKKWRQEYRESQVNGGLMKANEEAFIQWLDRQMLSNAQTYTIPHFYRWSGLPEDQSIRKGHFDPAQEVDD